VFNLVKAIFSPKLCHIFDYSITRSELVQVQLNNRHDTIGRRVFIAKAAASEDLFN
jgi:hypothetical protein